MTTNADDDAADDYAAYKLCTGTCDSRKPLGDFYRHGNECKACRKRHNQEHCFAQMVRASKSTDKRRRRKVDEYPYVSADYLFKQYVNQFGGCIYCPVFMRIGAGVNRKTDPAGCTVERVNNDIAHYAFNCVLSCNRCNKQRQANVTFDAMIARSQ